MHSDWVVLGHILAKVYKSLNYLVMRHLSLLADYKFRWGSFLANFVHECMLLTARIKHDLEDH